MVIGICYADFAGLPAIRAIIVAIGAEADILHSLAVAAVAVALALTLRQIAL